MPENDDILGTDGAGGGQTQKQNSTAVQSTPPSVDSASVARAVKEAVGDLPGELRQYTEAITRYVDQRLGGAAGPAGGGKSDGSPAPDLTQQLLSDPRAAVRTVMDEWAAEKLAPYLSTKINDDFETLLDKQRERIDRQWGEGAFDTLIAKDVIDTANKTPNAAARGSKEYIAALVRGRVGHEDVLPKLQAHKTEYDAKHKDDDMPSGGGAFLDAGRRRPKNDTTFSEGDEAFMASYAAETGIELDKKLLGEAIKIRARDGVWDTQNFPGVKNKLAVKAPRGKNFNAGRA